MDRGIALKRGTTSSRNYTSSRYEESKDSKPLDYFKTRDSQRGCKRSRSSKKYSKYSSKYLSGTSERHLRESSNTKEKKRDKKYKEKIKEDDFKRPSKYGITSSENKRRKEQK